MGRPVVQACGAARYSQLVGFDHLSQTDRRSFSPSGRSFAPPPRRRNRLTAGGQLGGLFGAPLPWRRAAARPLRPMALVALYPALAGPAWGAVANLARKLTAIGSRR